MSMDKKKMAFVQRVEQNSKNYHPRDLFDLEAAGTFLGWLKEQYGLYTMMTDRHGAIVMTYGEFGDFKPDVVNAPGMKIRVRERTVCHIYAKYDCVEEKNKTVVNTILNAYIKTLEGFSEKSYLASEQAVYIDELEQELERETYQSKYGEQHDPLTGVLNRTCFLSRMKQLTEREIVPTAAICVNINDWKFVDDHFGEEESDRLIVIVADILQKSAGEISGGENAIIGRMEGDVFHILLPLVEEYDAKKYCRVIQDTCQSFTDPILAPSIAVGCVMKTNVEETFKDLFSDAEYEMLAKKLEIKQTPGYRERLEKGINR